MKPLFEIPAMLALDGQELTAVKANLNTGKSNVRAPGADAAAAVTREWFREGMDAYPVRRY